MLILQYAGLILFGILFIRCQ